MLTSSHLENLKTQFGHIFEIEDNGNLILKDHFGIPSFRMIYVKRGEFMMGEGKDKHKVKLSPFYMAEYPVTQEFYRAVAGQNPSKFEGLNHPVEQVSWYNAVEFCDILNKKIGISGSFYSIDKINKDKNNQNKDEEDKLKWTVQINPIGNGFRLPTEAEWEFAARGGASTSSAALSNQCSVTTYAGSDHLDEVAWYDKNNKYETKPVGLKFPNSLGIYELSGNVFEWCWDWYGSFNNNKDENPLGAESGSARVVRGGAWSFGADDCRLSDRFNRWPINSSRIFGFRLVFDLQFT